MLNLVEIKNTETMSQKSSINEKKRTELYGVVHGDIMQARIQLLKLFRLNSEEWNRADSILYRLHMDAPENAVRVFDRSKIKKQPTISKTKKQ